MENWRDYAKCKGEPVSIFFPADGDKKWTDKKAKQICEACPVINDCLEYALKAEIWGVYGGKTPWERENLRVQRGLITRRRANCGTEGGWLRHKKNKDYTCPDCIAAHNEFVAEQEAEEKLRGLF